MHFASATLLSALVGTVAAGTVLWDGRLNDLTSSADLNKWSWSSQVGPYQYYIHGSGAVTDYVNLNTSYKNPADAGSTKGAKLTIDNTSHWNGQTMYRTELIPQTSAAINKGKVWYHFSMKTTGTNPPDATAEHQLCFFESHFTEMKYGTASGGSGSDKTLRWAVNRVTQWNTTLVADVWHNIAYEIDFSAGSVSFYHSTGADGLVLKAGPVSVSASSDGKDWHLGVLRLPVNGETTGATEDWYFSGVYVESGSLTTKVCGPEGSGAGSATPGTVVAPTTQPPTSSPTTYSPIPTPATTVLAVFSGNPGYGFQVSTVASIATAFKESVAAAAASAYASGGISYSNVISVPAGTLPTPDEPTTTPYAATPSVPTTTPKAGTPSVPTTPPYAETPSVPTTTPYAGTPSVTPTTDSPVTNLPIFSASNFPTPLTRATLQSVDASISSLLRSIESSIRSGIDSSYPPETSSQAPRAPCTETRAATVSLPAPTGNGGLPGTGYAGAGQTAALPGTGSGAPYPRFTGAAGRGVRRRPGRTHRGHGRRPAPYGDYGNGNGGAAGAGGAGNAGANTGNSGASGNAGAYGASGNAGANSGNYGASGNAGANSGNYGASGNAGASTGNYGASGNGGGNTGNTGASSDAGANTGNYGASGNAGANTGNYGASGNAGADTGNYGASGNAGANTGNYGVSGNSGANTGNTGASGNAGAGTGNYGASSNVGADTGNYGASGNAGANTGNYAASGNSGANTGNYGAYGNAGAGGNNYDNGNVAAGGTGNSGTAGNAGAYYVL